MDEGKFFGVELLGFSKKDVNTYIESMSAGYEEQKKNMSDKISDLSKQLEDNSKLLDEVSKERDRQKEKSSLLEETVNQNNSKIEELNKKIFEGEQELIKAKQELSQAKRENNTLALEVKRTKEELDITKHKFGILKMEYQKAGNALKSAFRSGSIQSINMSRQPSGARISPKLEEYIRNIISSAESTCAELESLKKQLEEIGIITSGEQCDECSAGDKKILLKKGINKDGKMDINLPENLRMAAPDKVFVPDEAVRVNIPFRQSKSDMHNDAAANVQRNVPARKSMLFDNDVGTENIGTTFIDQTPQIENDTPIMGMDNSSDLNIYSDNDFDAKIRELLVSPQASSPLNTSSISNDDFETQRNELEKLSENLFRQVIKGETANGASGNDIDIDTASLKSSDDEEDYFSMLQSRFGTQQKTEFDFPLNFTVDD